MPEKGQWRLTDLQRFLAVLTVVVALFLAAMALGMGSVVLVLVAVAMLVVAGLAVFLLGLFYNSRGGIRGTATVQSASPAPLHNIRGRCDLRLLVRLAGRPPVMMKHRDPAVPVHKWPEVGMILPVEVPVDKPGQLRILWERVPDVASRGGGIDGAMPPVEPTVPVFTQYAEELQAPGLAYNYLEDSPTPPWPIQAEPTRSKPTRSKPTRSEPTRSEPTRSEPTRASVPEQDRTPDPMVTTQEDPQQVDHPAPDRPIPGDAGPDHPDHDDPDLDDLDLDPELDDFDPNDLGLDLGAADVDGSGLDRALKGDTIEAETVRPVVPPGSGLPTRGSARPASVPAPRTEHVPPPSTPVDAEVVEDSATSGGPGGLDPTGMDVMLVVSGLKASLAFYEGMLHLPVLDQTESTAVLSTGGGRVILQQMVQMSPVERRVMHLQLRVRNVEAVYRELRRRGVTFAHRPRVIWPTDRDEVTVATCRDPDGHAVSLTEWRLRSSGQSPSD